MCTTGGDMQAAQSRSNWIELIEHLTASRKTRLDL